MPLGALVGERRILLIFSFMLTRERKSSVLKLLLLADRGRFFRACACRLNWDCCSGCACAGAGFFSAVLVADGFSANCSILEETFVSTSVSVSISVEVFPLPPANYGVVGNRNIFFKLFAVSFGVLQRLLKAYLFHVIKAKKTPP